MGMGMMFEFLIPGVKHAEEADLGADNHPEQRESTARLCTDVVSL
jgi:hypothetical protein